MTYTKVERSNTGSTSSVSDNGRDETNQTENQTNEAPPAPVVLNASKKFIYDLTGYILCACEAECDKCRDGKRRVLHSIKCEKKEEPCTVLDCESIRETLTKWFVYAYPEKDFNTGMQTYDIEDLKDLTTEAAAVALVLFNSQAEEASI